MIVVDTSALIAILLGEDEAPEFAKIIENDEEPLISVASVVELYMVMRHKQGPATRELVDKLLSSAAMTICPVTIEHARIAGEAIHKYSSKRFFYSFFRLFLSYQIA